MDNIGNLGSNNIWKTNLNKISDEKEAQNIEKTSEVSDNTADVSVDSEDEAVALTLNNGNSLSISFADSDKYTPIKTITYGENGEYTVTTSPGRGVVGGSSTSTTYNKDGIKLRESSTSIGTDKPYTWTTEFDSDGKAMSETFSNDKDGKDVVYKDVMKYDDNGNLIGKTRTNADGTVTELDKDGKEIRGSVDTPKVKEGEKGSLSYLKNVLSLDNNKNTYSNIEYDSQGRIISFNEDYEKSPFPNQGGATGKHYSITYNDDGTFEVKSNNIQAVTNPIITTQKFDKDGKEINDTGDTPKVKDGEIGSLTYLKNLIKNFDESCSPINYDAQGRIIFMFNGCNTDRGYQISYENNGDVTVVYSGFSTPKITSTYHKDGSYEEIVDYNFDFPSKNIIETKKYDKDGKEINDTGDTPKVKEGEVGSIAFISSLIDKGNEGIEQDTIKKDNKGRITYFEIGNKKYDISYNDDNTITVDPSWLLKKSDGTYTSIPMGSIAGAKVTYNSNKEKIREEFPSNGFSVGPQSGHSTVLEYENGKVIRESKIWDREAYHNGIKTEITIYNNDGSTTVKKLDVEGKDVTNRPELEYGAVGSLEYLDKILDATVTCLKPTYDEQGRICELNYDENYMSNGMKLTSDEQFVKQNYDENFGCEVTKCELTYNADGTVSVKINGDNSLIKKFDKDGKEIKDTSETPKVKEGEKGSLSWIRESFGLESINPKSENVIYDEQGRIKTFYAENSSITQSVGSTPTYHYQKFDVTYNDDGSVNILQSNISSKSYTGDVKNIVGWTKKYERTINPDGTRTRIFYDEKGTVLQIKKYEKGEEDWKGTVIELPKEGEKGSLSFLNNVLSLDGEKNDYSYIKYDSNGRIISFNVVDKKYANLPDSTKHKHYSIKYNDDGSFEVKSNNMNIENPPVTIQKFDKDGKEIKDTSETPKVKEGEKGSLTAINKLINKNLTSDIIYDVSYDDNGRITSMRSREGSEDNIKSYEYDIKYNDDGSFEIKTVNLNYKSDESTSIITYDKNNNKTVEVLLKPNTTELLSKTEYDKNGNVKSQLFPVESGNVGSLEYFKNLLNINNGGGRVELNYEKGIGTYDEQGRLTSFNCYLTLTTIAIPNDTRISSKHYDIKYNDDGSFEITTTAYRKNGTSDTSVMKYDKDGNLISTDVTPEETTEPTMTTEPQPTQETSAPTVSTTPTAPTVSTTPTTPTVATSPTIPTSQTTPVLPQAPVEQPSVITPRYTLGRSIFRWLNPFIEKFNSQTTSNQLQARLTTIFQKIQQLFTR